MSVSDLDTVILANTPALFYKFDEASGAVIDYGSLGFNLSANGTIGYAQANILPAYGSRTCIRGNTGTSNNFLSSGGVYGWPGPNLTVEVIFKISSYTNIAHRTFFGTSAIAAAGSWEIQLRNATGAIRFRYWDGTTRTVDTTAITSLKAGEYHHLVVRVTGTTLEIILDGEVQVLTLPSTPLYNAGGTLTLKTCSSNTEYSPYYAMAAVYHSALTDANITSHLRAARAIDDSAELIADGLGDRGNLGTYAAPLELGEMLRATYLIGKSGTLRIKGGTHISPTNVGYEWKTDGGGNTLGTALHIKPVDNEIVMIDGFNSLGDYGTYNPSVTVNEIKTNNTWIWDIFATCTYNDIATNRARPRPDAFNLQATNSKLIGCIAYDCGVGYWGTGSSLNLEIHACSAFLNGEYLDEAANHNVQYPEVIDPTGHNVYVHSQDRNNPVLFKNCLFHSTADNNLQGFGTTVGIEGLHLDGLICFNPSTWWRLNYGTKNIFFLAQKPMLYNEIRNCIVGTAYGGSGYTYGKAGDPHEYFTIEDNISYGEGEWGFVDLSHATVNRNRSINLRPSAQQANNKAITYIRPVTAGGEANDHPYDGVNKGYWTGDLNEYSGYNYTDVFDALKTWAIFHEDGVASYSLTEWKALTGIDTNAVLRNFDTDPLTIADLEVHYRPNVHKPGFGFIAVLNPTEENTVNVDLSQLGIVTNDVYVIYHSQNPFTVLHTGTYADVVVAVDLTTTKVTTHPDFSINGNASDRLVKNFQVFTVAKFTSGGASLMPSELMLTRVSPTSIQADWVLNPLVTETSVVVEYSTDQATWTPVALSAGAETHTENGLSAGQRYYFRVKTANAIGESPYSSVMALSGSSANYYGGAPTLRA